MVISSTDGAARHQGGNLGQYEYYEDKGYYVQTSTEQSNENFEAVYLYRDKNDEWLVGPTPGEETGWLWNPRSSKTPPSSGWQYSDGTGTWPSDHTLTVTPGPLPPLPTQFTVIASGAAAKDWPESLGVFTKSQSWWHGRPIYVNTEGQLLYHGNQDDGWVIGSKLGKVGLSGSQSHHSPASEDSWRYWTGSESEPASVTVTGSD